MLTYIDNPDWKQSPVPEEGDAVDLHARNTFGYTVRVLVLNREADTITGRIEAILEVTEGEALRNIGQVSKFHRSKIFHVIRRQIS